jgi:hypothetical protein
MARRSPYIKHHGMLGLAERMLAKHKRYARVGHAGTAAAAKIRTAVEVSVMKLTHVIPRDSKKRGVPHLSSLEYRGVIASTTRAGSGGTIGRRRKKIMRSNAFDRLIAALDFLDS